MKAKVGQKVWLVRRDYRSGKSDPTEETVSKVGRKYFELKNHYHTFVIETGVENVDSSYKDRVYESLQEILEEREHSELSSKIQSAFRFYGKAPFTLEQLRQINSIINL